MERRVVVARSGVGARGGPGWTRIAVTSGGEAFFSPVCFVRKINKHKKTETLESEFRHFFHTIPVSFFFVLFWEASIPDGFLNVED